MKDRLSHRERIQTILAGEMPDRFAASFWRHFFHKEHSAVGTAEAMLSFQLRFDWDFMKINPRADYHIEDWGLKQRWSTNEFAKHEKIAWPVRSIEDWAKIDRLPTSAPALAEHLKLVSLIKKGAASDLPLLMTVFTPLAIAGRMVPDNSMLVEHMRTAPERVLPAIQAITETFVRYVAELRNAGADGLFFATTHWASKDMLSWDEYQRFGVPYDLRVIEAAGDEALNLFHVCGSNNYLKELSQLDYRSTLVNWDSADPTNLPLDKAEVLIPQKVLVGGVDHRGWLIHGEAQEIPFLVDGLKNRHDPRRVIIGPGCAIEPETPMENLQAIRDRL